MNFCSDNVTGAAPEILAALARANDGPAAAYGDDPLTRAVETRIANLFECDAAVFLVATGTAANAMVGTTAVGSIAPGQANPVVVTSSTNGVISTVFGAGPTGVIAWELLWRPLSAGATVTPA